MKLKRKKIKFANLLNIGGGYTLGIQLEVLNWMLKTGKGKGYEKQYGWHREGVDKQVFGYSANNRDSYSVINGELRLFFLNAILAEADTVVQKWRDDHKIALGSSFMLQYVEFDPPYMDIYRNFGWLQMLANKKLVKKYYQPAYKDRIDPYVRSVKFCCAGNGLELWYDYTYPCCADSGWTNRLRQEPEESIKSFLERCCQYFNNHLQQKET